MTVIMTTIAMIVGTGAIGTVAMLTKTGMGEMMMTVMIDIIAAITVVAQNRM